ncbi:hypothetical protein [Bartonella sp. MM73XJBT.G]|uniref:hypothetical protein n=1 Tax=Bartonella sp. MM73XJBT.G TaxID=3019097 RepID=UPI0038576CF5
MPPSLFSLYRPKAVFNNSICFASGFSSSKVLEAAASNRARIYFMRASQTGVNEQQIGGKFPEVRSNEAFQIPMRGYEGKL